jgi:hypothetical protein
MTLGRSRYSGENDATRHTNPEARWAFDAAVRALAVDTEPAHRAGLIEEIIYSSRHIAEDESLMVTDVSIALSQMLSRFSSVLGTDIPRAFSYREARYTLRELFF